MATLESILVAGAKGFTGNYSHDPDTDKDPWFGRPLYKGVKIQAGEAYQKLNFNGKSPESKARTIDKLLNRIGRELYGPMPGKINPAIKAEGDKYVATYKIKNTTFSEGLLNRAYERTLTVAIDTKSGDISIEYEAPAVPIAAADADADRMYSALKSKQYMFVMPKETKSKAAPKDAPKEAKSKAKAEKKAPAEKPSKEAKEPKAEPKGAPQAQYEKGAEEGYKTWL